MSKKKHKRHGKFYMTQRIQATPINRNSVSPQNGAVAVAQVTTQIHQGPLPAPESLEKYDNVCPGAANRIIAMAENQSAHRQRMETIVIKGGARNATFGLVAGFLLGVFGIACGTWLISIDKSIQGFITMLGSIGSLAGVFIYGKERSIKELERKRQQ